MNIKERVTIKTLLIISASYTLLFNGLSVVADPLRVGHRPPVPKWEQVASDAWYEGALLGNGDLGVIVFGADDQIIFGLGKNDMWDRRYYYKLYKPLSFQQYMAMAKSKWPTNPETGKIVPQDEAFETYKPMPRIKPQPKPVCQIIIESAGKGTEGKPKSLAPIRHSLSLETAELRTTSPLVNVLSRVQKNNNLAMINIDCPDGGAVIKLFRPRDDTNTNIQPPIHKVEDDIALVIQDMPAEDSYPNGFRCVVAASMIGGAAKKSSEGHISWRVNGKATLILAVVTTRDNPKPVNEAKKLLVEALRKGDENLYSDHQRLWKKFWDASWIKIDDPQVETLWYVHNYLLACATRPGAVAPSLFGPWIVNDTSPWGGGYTMDYNFQQTFAAALSCNHPELLQAYFETIEKMLPAARQCAKELFEAEGIAFPHQIFPTNMWRQWHACDAFVCETPWTIQHFWDYYEHTMDEDFLRTRGYPVIADGADFLASYATPEENGRFAFEPTVSPEHHGLVPGLPFNRNGTPELGFARYIFKAALQGAKILGLESARTARWKTVLNGLPDYPRARNQLGEIFLDCEAIPSERNLYPPVSFVANQRPSKRPGNHGPWMTYNCPTSLLQVWPAGQIDSDSSPDDLLTAIRTWHTAKFEGSNDLIIRHVVAARLGIPTLEQFKREIAPRLMPNGSITCLMNPIFDKDAAETIYMYRKHGIWTENFAYPLVINEMMLQSHNSVIKLFPTMDYYRKAEFHNLRARGGLLVSAAMDRGFVLWSKIVPTVTVTCRVRSPWPTQAISLTEMDSGETVSINYQGNDIVFKAIRGKAYHLEPIIRKW